MSFSLLLIEHHECLASVANNPRAYVFKRSSYCVAPPSWRALKAADLKRRVRILLDAAYQVRNAWVYQTDDPNPMILLKHSQKWVDEAAFAAQPWKSAFQAFQVSDDGKEWHIVKDEEREAIFAERLLALH
jgi:hypothetical protein